MCSDIHCRVGLTFFQIIFSTLQVPRVFTCVSLYNVSAKEKSFKWEGCGILASFYEQLGWILNCEIQRYFVKCIWRLIIHLLCQLSDYLITQLYTHLMWQACPHPPVVASGLQQDEERAERPRRDLCFGCSTNAIAECSEMNIKNYESQ